VTQHIGFVPYRNLLLRWLVGAANRLVGGFVLGRATRVVFESETVRQYFARFVRFRAAPLLVPNGVDSETFVPADPVQREAARARLGVPPGAPLFLFIGRFVEKKGLSVLQTLAERFTQARWIIAGWGPMDPEDWRLPNVVVVRSPGIDELLPLYQAADLFVLPSAGEGLPLAVQEAMACGTPVLIGTETAGAVDVPGAPMLSEETSGADVSKRWVDRIGALLLDAHALRVLRPRVAVFAREHWSWGTCVQRYTAALRNCVGRT